MREQDLEARLGKLEERLTALDRLYQQQLESVAKATALQATEYARRLDELNHERKRDAERQAHYVSQESCNLTHREVAVWREIVTKQLAKMEGAAEGKARAYAAIGSLLAISVAVMLKLMR